MRADVGIRPYDIPGKPPTEYRTTIESVGAVAPDGPAVRTVREAGPYKMKTRRTLPPG